MHGETPYLVPDHLALACMQSGSHFDPQFADRGRDGGRALDRASRTIKGGEDAIARRVDLPTSKPTERVPHQGVVALEDITPPPVAEVGGTFGGTDDVRESTVKDLVAGSGIQFQSRGVHVLKGVPGEWHIYAVARA